MKGFAQHFSQYIASILVIAVLSVVESYGQVESCAISVPGQIFCDDFEDGNIVDGAPVSWTKLWTGEVDVEEGSLRLTNGGRQAFTTIVEDDENVQFADTSLCAEVRLNESELIGVAVRWNEGLDRSYGGMVSADRAALVIGGSLDVIGEASIDVDVTQQDVMIQLDVFGDNLEFWAWPVGTPMPPTPTLVAQNNEVSDGKMFLWTGTGDDDSELTADGSFRFVRAATQPIRDARAGDFDGNSVLNVNDIDLLISRMLAGTHDLAFDLTGDGFVNVDDLGFLVGDESTLYTYLGDANLDGEFNSSDLVAVFSAGEFEDFQALNSSWAEGDWDGNGDFGTSDLVAALTEGGFETGPKLPAAIVPEPTTAVLLIGGLLAALVRPRSILG